MSGSVSSLSIAATSAEKAEGNSGSTAFTFTVTRTGATNQASTAAWKVTGSGNTPALAQDFVGGALPSGTVSFAAGETSKVITVLVAGDAVIETNDGFSVTLSNTSLGTVIGTAAASGIIQNDDANLAIAATSAAKAEGQTGSAAFTFTITRSGSTLGSHSADWAVEGVSTPWAFGTNKADGTDFVGGVLPSGTVSFATGETSKTISVLVAGDNRVEPNEFFAIVLSNPSLGAKIPTATAGGAIVNDDKSITLNDGVSSDFFGSIVASSSDGRAVIVGAPGDDVGSNDDQGSARVFIWTGVGWEQRGAALTPSDGQPGDMFGSAVALSYDGRTAAIGSPIDSVGANVSQGSVRVFDWTGDEWVQRGGIISAPDGEINDQFGNSIALSADGYTLIVGGPGDDVGSNADQGSARVFDWRDNKWLPRGNALTRIIHRAFRSRPVGVLSDAVMGGAYGAVRTRVAA